MFCNSHVSALEGVLTGSKLAFADARMEETRERFLSLIGSEVVEAREGLSIGSNVRVWNEGKIGFISFSGLDIPREILDDVMNVAVNNLSGDEPTPSGSPVVQHKWYAPEYPTTKDFSKLTDELTAITRKTSCAGVPVSIQYEDYRSSKVVVTLPGTRIEITGGWIAVNVSVQVDGVIFENVVASARGFQDWSIVEQTCRSIVTSAVHTAYAPRIEPSVADIILDPELSGIFVHEMVGHTAEADGCADESQRLWGSMVGMPIGAPMISIVDEGNNIGYCGCLPYDDEGVPTRASIIVNKGIVHGSLHTRVTAARNGVESTGNARALHYRFPPITRMSCTYMTPGNCSVASLISGIRRGYFLVGHSGGQNDLSRSLFTSRESFEIKNGRLGKRVKPITVISQLSSTLWNVDGVSRDWKLYEAAGLAGCGKWDQAPLPVTFGGPYIRIRDAVVVP